MRTYKANCPEIELKYKTGDVKKMQIKDSRTAYEAFKLFYDMDTVELMETFIVIFLNRANNTIGWMKVSQGGITGTVVDPRLILGTALKCAATGMILSHNHPSGNIQPSDSDISLTRKIKEACTIMEISLIDHIIYTEKNYYSFADEGRI